MSPYPIRRLRRLRFVTVRESPEIAAAVLRMAKAWETRDFETYADLISAGPHFRGIGTDEDEFWESGEAFLGVRRVQSDELDSHGWAGAEATVERLEAFEAGQAGWASMFIKLRTPNGVVALRATLVLILEAGAWRIVQWHTSAPSPNVQTLGVELTTTLDDLLTSVAEDAAALETLARSEGTMTLVFTDIVDSTALAERIGDDEWVAVVGKHEADIRRTTAKHGGTTVKMLGDGSMLAFSSARAAVRAALEIHDGTEGAEFSVRIGIHSGEVVRREGDLLGLTVNKAARVASVAAPGQILASAVVAELLGAMDGVAFGPPEVFTLRGLSGTHILVAVESMAGR
jgi:adenylate cyclase